MTPAKLRREILGAMHALTGTMEPWREVGLVMRRYLGPWVGMSATERWETLGAVELELLADAVTERAAMVEADCSCRAPCRTCNGAEVVVDENGEDGPCPRCSRARCQSCSVHRREVIVCGGRDYQPTSEDGRWVTYWLAWLSARVVVHGGAPGVDRWAGTLAARLGLEAVCVPADWDTHGKAAGPIRNVAMAERYPVAVLALKGGSGTTDMVAKARARNILVLERNDPSTKAIAA
jgi:hypothetical protein